MCRFIASSLIYSSISYGKRTSQPNGAFGSQTRQVYPTTLVLPPRDLIQGQLARSTGELMAAERSHRPLTQTR